ncbi:MAG: hypothetical protein ACI3ZZ_01920 [Candidatus Aphodosoma sp.]
MEPFVFVSDCHQRYENGSEVMGLQQCVRTVSVEKNTNGCRGYRLIPGDGYIVKIFNDDIGNPNMSDKPMRIVDKTPGKVELRGFLIEAQTPFGWQEVDYSDYGFTVYYSNGKVSKCVLHMFDRNVDLEYRKSENSASYLNVVADDIPAKSKSKPHFEELAQQAMSFLQMGNDGDAVYHPMYKAWREIQQAPSRLKDVQDKALLGNGLFVFISYGTVQDIDDRQQIISLAYLLLSDAIKKDPTNLNLIRNRILVMLNDRDAFQYTVSSATNNSSGFDFLGLSPFKSRDALYTMIYSDLAKSSIFKNIPLLNATLADLERKIDNNFFGQNKSRAIVVSEGEKNHTKVLTFLREKVYDNADIDF